MRSEPHPISGAVYEEIGDGLVRVEDKAKGKSGVFRFDGTWIEGELTYADPHMLKYIGGPDLPPGRDIFWAFLPPLEDDIPTVTATSGRDTGKDAQQRPKIIAPYVGDPGKETPQGMRSASHVDLDFLLDNDRKPDKVPAVFRKSAPLPGGPRKVPVARYHDKKFHDLEVEHIWKKCWQLVCREDDIPETGDYHLYEIAHLQYLVVRQADGSIRAYPNACLHRGRQLRECHGKRATEFRCPYHGWTWGIDGGLKLLTGEWDFPGVREDVSQLPQARAATWAGFVFINPDPDPEGESLEDYMGPEMIEHYAKIKLQNRYKQADVVKVIRANWKVAQEAFQEGWHSLATHPQLLLQGGDLADLRFDVFGNWGRLGHVGVSGSSPHRGIVVPQEKVIDIYHQMADFNREYLRGLIGEEVEEYSDAELSEQTFNNLFPNFSPWGGWGRIVYRFRPYGDDPDQCLMQAMLLAPWPEGKPKPPPKAQRFLGPDDHWTQAPELGGLAKIFEQDVGNIPQVHKGLKTKQPPYVWVSGYQESILRNWHKLYEERLGLEVGE